MTNEEATKVIQTMLAVTDLSVRGNLTADMVKACRMAIKALSVEPQEWIPIKTRPLTKEEKEHYAEMGYSDDSVTFMYDCPLPDDGEEVLVTDWLGNVEFNTFIRDECDGCYFEENCDDGEVVAWKHKPSPYKGGVKHEIN